MARGLPRRVYVGQSGLESVYGQYDLDIIRKVYSVSGTKLDDFDVGDTVVFPDCREFVYSKSTGASALYSAQGVDFTYTGYVSYTAFAVAAAIGDTEVTVPAATHAALTQDELKGGYITIFDGSSNHYTTTRMIIGNDSADADAAFVVYLDSPLTYAVTASTSACEVWKNPYNGLTLASLDTLSKAGVPAVYVSASAQYFFCQTKGSVWLPPQTSNVGANGGRGCMWRHDGTLEGAETALGATVPSGDTSQYAGFCVGGSQAGNGPLFKLNG